MPRAKSNKARKNFMFPADLAAWAQKYARKNNTTLTQIIVDHLTELRRQDAHVEQI